VSRILVITGAQGTGKSQLAQFIESVASERLLVLDSGRPLTRAQVSALKKHDGPAVVVVNEVGDLVLDLGRRVVSVVELKAGEP
jgi:hypothetical protein